MTSPHAAASPRAGLREWVGLAVLVMPILVVSMDMSVLYLALPSLTVDLQPSSAEQLWILDIYSFMLAGLLVTMGSLGDRIGTRRLLMIGSVVFGVASVLAAFSQNPESLIASRVLLGIGGATLAPSTLSLLRKLFVDPVQRGMAVGVWTAGFAGGGSFGPVVAGFLLEHFWWGSLEYVSAGSGMSSPSALSISCHRGMSSQSTRVTAMPVRPARPVRPMRWT